jgi:hypothetical protein
MRLNERKTIRKHIQFLKIMQEHVRKKLNLLSLIQDLHLQNSIHSYACKYGFFVILQFCSLAFSEVSQIHFGTTKTLQDGLTITWSNTGTHDSIKWGLSNSSLNTRYAGIPRHFNLKNIFDYTFPELPQDTTIYYSIYDSNLNQWTINKTFHTSNNYKTNRFTFTAMGDSRTSFDDWKTISNAVLPSDFTLFMGDIVTSGGNLNDWDNWLNYGEEFLSNNLVYHTLGNHELNGDEQALNYQNLFVLPKNSENQELYYSFKYENALFICLNSSNPGDTIQYEWLINTLKINNDKKWKFVWFHKPFFTSPTYSREMDDYLSTWWQTFDDYNVDVIFNGHTHNYQRTVPINRNVSKDSAVNSYGDCIYQGRCQIVTGGAGAGAVDEGTGWFIDNSYSGLHFVNAEVFGDSLIVKVFDQNRSIIDSFSIIKNFEIHIDASSTDICDGNQVTLTGFGANTYVWNNDVKDGIPFRPFETKSYTLIGSDFNGCSDTVSIEVFVNPIYSYNDNYSICFGDSLFWQGVYYKATGLYFAYYKTAYGCDSIYKLNLTINPVPAHFEIYGPISVLENQKELYYVPNNTDVTYVWDVQNGIIINELSNDTIQVQWGVYNSGNILVISRNKYGCIGDSVTLNIDISALNLTKLLYKKNAKIYPNPAKTTINIDYNKEFTVEIFNISGNIVLISKNRSINISSLKSGYYIIMIKDFTNTLIHIERFIKE